MVWCGKATTIDLIEPRCYPAVVTVGLKYPTKSPIESVVPHPKFGHLACNIHTKNTKPMLI